MLEYETANPGADYNEKENEQFKFDEDNARGADIVRPSEAVPDIESRLGSAGTNSLGGLASRSSDPNALAGAGRPSNGDLTKPGDQAYRNGPVAESGDLYQSYRPNAGAA